MAGRNIPHLKCKDPNLNYSCNILYRCISDQNGVDFETQMGAYSALVEELVCLYQSPKSNLISYPSDTCVVVRDYT